MKSPKPTTLYRFFNMELQKHKITKDCMPSEHLINFHGTLYRCRCKDHDIYGYRTREEAKREEIETVRKEIYDRQQWLKKNGVL